MEKALKIKSIVEIVGTPQEHVEKAMSFVLEKLSQRSDLNILKKEVFPTEKMEDRPFWTSFCDLEFEVTTWEGLLSYCLDFLPSSIEIIEPQDANIPNHQLQGLFNDILGRMHQYEMVVKNEHAKVILLERELQKEGKTFSLKKKPDDTTKETKKKK